MLSIEAVRVKVMFTFSFQKYHVIKHRKARLQIAVGPFGLSLWTAKDRNQNSFFTANDKYFKCAHFSVVC